MATSGLVISQNDSQSQEFLQFLFYYKEYSEGFTGTTIKDRWTITRGVETGEGSGEGWGGGEGLGEKTEKCT